MVFCDLNLKRVFGTLNTLSFLMTAAYGSIKYNLPKLIFNQFVFSASITSKGNFSRVYYMLYLVIMAPFIYPKLILSFHALMYAPSFLVLQAIISKLYQILTLKFSFIYFFLDKVSYGLGWPQTHNVAEPDLELLILLSLHHKHWN